MLTRQGLAYEQTMRFNPWVQGAEQANLSGSIGPVAASSYVPSRALGGLVNLFTQQRPGGSAVLNYQQQQIANAQRAMQSQYQPQFQQPQFQQPQAQQPYQPQFQQQYQPQIMQPPTFQQGGGLAGIFSPNRQSLPGYRGFGSRQFRGVY